MNDSNFLGALRQLATKLQQETDYMFAGEYGLLLMHNLTLVNPPELSWELSVLAKQALVLRLEGLERTPFKRQLLDESDQFISKFFDKLPVPSETQP